MLHILSRRLGSRQIMSTVSTNGISPRYARLVRRIYGHRACYSAGCAQTVGNGRSPSME
ncbi:hypothetical protein [Bradyrhizobium sp. 14AA]